MKVGLYLKRLDWHDPNVASDRIRGEWVMKCCPEMEEWQRGQRYDAVIFHNPVQHIATTAGVKLLDVCDPMWQDPDEFNRVTKTVDGIVTATDELARLVSAVTKKPVRVIGDGHWLPFYETRLPNSHGQRARVAVWFGYADNAFSVRPLIPVLESADVRLKVIAERNPFPDRACVDFVSWRRDSFVREVSQADFAVLPMTRAYKSNNKDISALLCGIPVAKNASDIAYLLDPEGRRREMERADEIIARHDVRDRAREYMEWIRELCSARTK